MPPANSEIQSDAQGVESDLGRVELTEVWVEERPRRLFGVSRKVLHDSVVAEIGHPERAVRPEDDVGVGEGFGRAVIDDLERVQVERLEPAIGLGKPDLSVGRAIEAGGTRARARPTRAAPRWSCRAARRRNSPRRSGSRRSR